MSRLNDPALVREQYATEQGLEARRSLYSRTEGPDAREVAFEAVAEVSPGRVLEVGCGPGEASQRIAHELGSEVVAIDQSERMVELARARGVDARVADVQALPFADASFDCALAAWMLYHVHDVDRGLRELARVLRPGGRLVAVTNGKDHLRELRDLSGGRWWGEMSFSGENGEGLLRRRFRTVERRDASGWVWIDDDESIWSYFRSLSAVPLPEALVPHELPLRVRRAPVVFVAEKPASGSEPQSRS